MTTIKKLVLGALTLTALAASANAAAPAPAPLSRAEMTSIRGESFISYGALEKDKQSCRNRANCSPGSASKTYNRGCSATNRCARH